MDVEESSTVEFLGTAGVDRFNYYAVSILEIALKNIPFIDNVQERIDEIEQELKKMYQLQLIS